MCDSFFGEEWCEAFSRRCSRAVCSRLLSLLLMRGWCSAGATVWLLCTRGSCTLLSVNQIRQTCQNEIITVAGRVTLNTIIKVNITHLYCVV
jgi:hypothetical protein